MDAEKVRNEMQCKRIVAIIRGVGSAECVPVAEALLKGRVNLMEITFDQMRPSSWPDTALAIQKLADFLDGRGYVGAGTVLSAKQVQMAYDAGAQFIISPDSNEAVIKRTKELGMVSIPGALTPTEMEQAYTWGADFVKIFPAANLGAGYIKAICSPCGHIPLMAVGGIDAGNLREFLNAGCIGAGIGGTLVNQKVLRDGNYDAITQEAERLMQIVDDIGK